jgi:DNA invertase Pin-like site-specific DNA recombinase
MNTGSAERRDGVPVASSKITGRHLERLAFVYVRQSHAIQIIKNPESTRVQYSLTEHAVGLGWSRERVLVIDEDQAHTATTSEGRLGFQRLVAEVGLGHVGIIVGVQMSRLARSCSDWYQLIDACALFGTLLGDFDGVYDPAIYNDRLLLGLKGLDQRG